jgi:hypothetical protein
MMPGSLATQSHFIKYKAKYVIRKKLNRPSQSYYRQWKR